MRTPTEYLNSLLNYCQVLPPEQINLADTIGCVTATDIFARIPLPRFDNSAMDGFAVCNQDIQNAKKSNVNLKISNESMAGETSAIELTPNTAIRIMTGAPVPNGADTVIPIEHTSERNGFVEIHSYWPTGSNIRCRGEDVEIDSLILSKNSTINVRELALLAGTGISEVAVHPRPKVGVISTGDELVQIGSDLPDGAIYDVNAPMLKAQLERLGAHVTIFGAIADEKVALEKCLHEATNYFDLIITSGGISMGNRDFVKEILTECGGVTFEKIAMQPGMPQGSGMLANTPIISLPGNPVSSYISAELFVKPFILKMRGYTNIAPLFRTARCAMHIEVSSKKEQYLRATVIGDDDLEVIPGEYQGSHMLKGLASSNSLIKVPIGTSQINIGELVEIIDLRERN